MEVEKRSLKGGFLQLFDWNSKSRKKLFSNKSEVPESSKQGKENFNGSPLSQFEKVQDYRFALDAKQNYDYHSGVSVSGDEDYGQRPPGVVARLMGLDSLPTTSQVSELCQAPPPYSHSYRDPHYPRATTGFENEHHMVVYENIRNKLDGFSMNPVEMRMQKVQNLPIERFQSEVLPPKSAKPISITQHRMLSPIKSPGFIPPKNAEYIMEAAARIIHQSPRLTVKNKMQHCNSSSSVALRIRDLRQKMDTAQKPSKAIDVSQRVRDHNAVKHLRRQPSDRVQGQPEETRSLWAARVSKCDVSHSKGKEKSVSLAVQARANTQKREGPVPTGNRTSVTSKEYTEGKSVRNRSNAQKSVERRTLSKPSNVLRQNNQKQNLLSNKEGESTKSVISYPKERKSSSTNDISRPSKTVKNTAVNNRTSSGAAKSLSSDAGREPSSSRSKTLSRNEVLVNEGVQSDGTVANNILKSKDDKSVKCNVTIEGCNNWDGVERKNGMDVISFTFTSPIKKTMSGPTPSSQAMEKKNILSLISDSCDNQPFTKSSPPPSGLNVLGGDALGILLDEKLKELTSIVESSGQDTNEIGSISSAANTSQDSAPSLDSQSIISTEHYRSQSKLIREMTDMHYSFVVSPLDVLQPKTSEKSQQSEDTELDSNGIYTGHEREFNSQYPSPASSLEPSFSAESCTLSDSNESFIGDGTKNQFAGSQEAKGWHTSITLSVEDDIELLDSASSLSMGNINRMESTIAFIAGLTYWELEYISDILRNSDLMMKESVPSEAHRIISADLFDQLEIQKIGPNKNVEDLKARRKVLFDCVVEQVEFRCLQSFNGSFQTWARWTELIQRKDWLAEELYREISGWTNMEDLMVDELVDKDMSTRLGKWTEFETDELEEGIEIEKGILMTLVEELVYDILRS